MSFFSFQFAVFLIAALVLYYIFPLKYRWTVLLLASLVFYCWGGATAVLFVLFTALTIWGAGMMMDRIETAGKATVKQFKEQWTTDERKAYKEKIKRRKKAVFLAALLTNLAILAVIKYYNFAAENLLHLLGRSDRFSAVSFIVPLGISFYTFQAVGYLIDVYNGKYEPERNPAKFLLFVSFFPQVVQGPIGRYDQLAAQLSEGNSFDYDNLRHGAVLLLWGCFLKRVVADRVAPLVATVFGNAQEYGGCIAMLGVLGYALQLYADFAGGIDIVSGVAEMFGIRLAPNFKRPYFSVSLGEFWRRWHISLGAWMRDYLFYPLALSKPVSKASKKLQKFSPGLSRAFPAVVGNLVVFFVVGVWHGAQWSYILWGLYNGAVLAASAVCEPRFKAFNERHPKLCGSGFWHVFRVLRTFAVVCVGFYFDRAEHIRDAFMMLKRSAVDPWIFQLNKETLLSLGMSGRDYKITVIALLVLFCVSLAQERGLDVRRWLDERPTVLRWLVLYTLLFSVVAFAVTGDALAGFMYAVF